MKFLLLFSILSGCCTCPTPACEVKYSKPSKYIYPGDDQDYRDIDPGFYGGVPK